MPRAYTSERIGRTRETRVTKASSFATKVVAPNAQRRTEIANVERRDRDFAQRLTRSGNCSLLSRVAKFLRATHSERMRRKAKPQGRTATRPIAGDKQRELSRDYKVRSRDSITYLCLSGLCGKILSQRFLAFNAFNSV